VLLSVLAAPIVMADKGYDADQRVLQPLAQAGKTAVIPPPRRIVKHSAPRTKTCTKHATWSKTFLASSNNFALSPLVRTRPPATF
jgi:hypothetical protein